MGLYNIFCDVLCVLIAFKCRIMTGRKIKMYINFVLFQWLDCIQIGRDLVRLLQDVARIPEFEALWKEILHNPSALEPSFKGLYTWYFSNF